MMDIMEAMKARHSVRQYDGRSISSEAAELLGEEIERCNEEGGLHIQLVRNEPKAFDGFMAHYGKFSGVTDYIVLVGKKSNDLDEKCGYYGERLVLTAQRLELNTCWVALTYKKVKGAFEVRRGEKLTVVIALGYGKTQGIAHKNKDITDISNVSADSPEWFKAGVEAALLAPTAMNQQKFKFIYDGDKVTAKAGVGFYTKIDLGIAKLHFELASGKRI